MKVMTIKSRFLLSQVATFDRLKLHKRISVAFNEKVKEVHEISYPAVSCS